MVNPCGDAAAPHATARSFTTEAGFHVRIHESLDTVDALAWDALAGTGAVVRSFGYLRAIAAAGVNDCRYFYPVVSDAAGRLLAHCCVYVITTDLLQILPAALQPWARAVRRVWPGFLRVRITECASPHVVGQSFSFAPDAPREPLLTALDRAISTIAEAMHSPLIVVRDFRDDELADFGALVPLGYLRVANMPMSRIAIRWESHAAYLAAMKSRYRKDLGRRLRRAAAAGREVRRLDTFAERAEVCSEQVQLAYARSQGVRREILGAAYYREIDQHLGAHSHLLAAEENGHMVGHGLLLTDDTHVVATWSGRDAGPPGDVWFSLLDAAVRFAIERRAAWLNLGLGTYAAKSLLGAEPVALSCFVRSRYRLANRAMALIPDFMARHPPDVHHVFR